MQDLISTGTFADWAKIDRDCPESVRRLPLSDINAPVRIKKLAAKLKLLTIGDLLKQGSECIFIQKNIGRKSICDFLEAVRVLFLMNADPGQRLTEFQRSDLNCSSSDWTQMRKFCPDNIKRLIIADISLPLRIKKIAARLGLTAVGDLLDRSCEDLLKQKNIGRRSIRDVLVTIRTLILMNLDSTSEVRESFLAFENDHASPWNQFRWSNMAELRDVSCSKVDLPTRIVNLLADHNIQKLGGVLSWSESDLLKNKNIGRKSIEETVAALKKVVVENKNTSERSLKQMWERAVADLDVRSKKILLSRLGGKTLEDIGHELHLTRERVRQIEDKAWKRLDRKQGLCTEITEKLNKMQIGMAAPVSIMASYSWFSDWIQDLRPLVNLLKRGDSPYRVIRLFGVPIISRINHAKLKQIYDRCWKKLEDSCELPIPYKLAKDQMEKMLPANENLARVFWEHRENDLIITGLENDQQLIVGWRRKINERVVGLLLAAKKPLRKEEIETAIGARIGNLPESVIYFGRGLIGLEEHFPDLDLWKTKLIPRCIELMKSGNSGRQWSSVELLQKLRATAPMLLPEWLTPSQLGSLLKRASGIVALGRFRFTLGSPKRGKISRLHLHDLFVEELLKAKIPLPRNELVRWARARSTVLEAAVNGTLAARPFVQVDRKCWGLIQRDLPGGERALTKAEQKIKGALLRTGRGMTIRAALDLVARNGGHSSGWSKEMVISAIRVDKDFKLDRRGAIGLAEWNDTRVEGYGEFLQHLIRELPEPTSIVAVLERFRDEYRRAPSMQRLDRLVGEIGYRISGPYILPIISKKENPKELRSDSIDGILQVLLG